MTEKKITSDQKKQTTAQSTDLKELLGTLNKNKNSNRKLIYASAAILLIGAAAIYYIGFTDKTANYIYTTEALHKGDLSVAVISTGSVQPTDQIDISSELSGTIRNVNVTYNSIVKAGDVLAELDTNKLEADLQSSKAKLASANASVKRAEAELNSANNTLVRRKALVQNKVSSQQELDAAQYTYDSAEANLDVNKAAVLSAEADLRLAEVNLSKSKIISPIDGVILTRNVEPGATVASSLNAPVLFTIAGDLRHMELQVAVDEADVGKVKEGQEASFNVDAYPEKSFPAKIENVRFASEVVANVVTYKAILSVDNEDMLLRPGMTATANITVEDVDDALLVPNAALRFRPQMEGSSTSSGLTNLFRPPMRPNRNSGNNSTSNAAGGNTLRTLWILKNGVPTPIEVQAGLTDGRFTAVTSSELKEGDLVITDAVARNN